MNSKNSVLLVVNPIAGGSDKEDIIKMIQAQRHERNVALEVYNTSGTNDKEAIDQLIHKIKPNRILVAGGDGTISLVAQCIHQKEIYLGIISAGSANGMAANIGLPLDIQDQIEIALSENILAIDVIFIDGRICLHIADLGINAELVKNYEASNVRGKFGYFLQSFPTLFNSDSPFEFTIETADGIYEETGILLAIANANKFGTGANINPNGKINDGKFEILVFKNFDFIEILKTAQDNPDMSPEFVSVFSTDKAQITNKTLVPFQIDGEYIGEVKSTNVKIERESLYLAVPETFLNLHKNKTLYEN